MGLDSAPELQQQLGFDALNSALKAAGEETRLRIPRWSPRPS